MKGRKRPVIMDGQTRFQSIGEAARWVKAHHGSAATPSSIRASIQHVVTVGRGHVYGHRFQDDTWPTTPAEYERELAECRTALIAMWRIMDISALKGEPVPRATVDGLAEKLNARGLGVS
jgi:hypothetical protein